MKIKIIIIFLFIQSCGIFNRIPTSQDNACELLVHKLSWKRAVNATEKSGVYHLRFNWLLLKPNQILEQEQKLPGNFSGNNSYRPNIISLWLCTGLKWNMGLV